MLYVIENDCLKVTVNSEGGAMTSLVYKKERAERLHKSDEWWKGQDVVIFPIIGHAGEFAAKGKKYALKSHGLIRYAELGLLEKSGDFLRLGFNSTPTTRESFPYDFEFEVSYKMEGSSVTVGYFVKSLSGEMPFYVGGHPGTYAPGGRAEISFENVERPLLYPLDGSGAVPVGELKGFTADKEFFKEYKTCQLGSLSGGAVYAKTDDGYLYTYRSDCRLYAFWSNEEGGDYICVEPWWGINDYTSAPREMSLKPFMNFDRGEGSRFYYTLTVEKVK